ncbi:MAG: hypothetical protein D6E12_05660 [Desulfovibrio sp.]|nr:MAG: hypothetical protein D6E12_05660 [Desulfovibrio sp.]
MGIYIVDESGNTQSLDRYHCSNETKELHELVKLNHDMLPGDQIDPLNHRKWLLVKHEMPVKDPESGSERWSLDLFFLDQDAVPTFVECKRFKDTRARREVVAQMIDYAANSHVYLDSALMRQYAEKSAEERGLEFEDLFSGLEADFNDVTEYFERASQNLKDGRVRLIFLLEDSPNALRTMVTFLNNQMTRTEVMIVELKFYVLDGLKVVRPSLYGYTEQAYVMKKEVVRKETRSPSVLCVDDSSFLDALESKSGNRLRACAENLFKKLDEKRIPRTYAPQTARLLDPGPGKKVPLILGIDGVMYINISGMEREGEHYAQASNFAKNFGIEFSETAHGKTIKPQDFWCDHIDAIVDYLQSLISGA